MEVVNLSDIEQYAAYQMLRPILLNKSVQSQCKVDGMCKVTYLYEHFSGWDGLQRGEKRSRVNQASRVTERVLIFFQWSGKSETCGKLPNVEIKKFSQR